MEALLHTGVNVKELAERCGVSRVTLFRAFKERFKCGPEDYLERARLAKAKELLSKSQASVSFIAKASGFRSAAYFNRRFRLLEGVGPKEFRASKLGGP